MADTFDPYHIWLGIPPGQRPPTHYQLLGISPEEHDRTVINGAVTRQSAYVRNFQAGQHGADAARLLGEFQAAKICLLDPVKRAEYDAKFARKEAARVKPVTQTAANLPQTGSAIDRLLSDVTPPVPSAGRGVRRPPPRLALAPKKQNPAVPYWLLPAGMAAVVVVVILALLLRPQADRPSADRDLTQDETAERQVADAGSATTSPADTTSPAPSAASQASKAEPKAAPSVSSPTVPQPGPLPITPEPAKPAEPETNASPAESETMTAGTGTPSVEGNATKVADADAQPEEDPAFAKLTAELNNLASWTKVGGQWSAEDGAIHGRGDGGLKFHVELPTDFLLTLRIKVLEGIRPRLFFGANEFWFGNEGFERTMFVYGEGQRNIGGAGRDYNKGVAFEVACRFSGQDMEFSIDGQPVAHSQRKKVGPSALMLSSGDPFSPGHVVFDQFKLSPLPGSAAPASTSGVGVDVPDEVDGAKGGSSLAIDQGFDFSKSWRLSLEFWAANFQKGDHGLLFWGDERAGQEALALKLTGIVLTGQAANVTGGTKGPALTARMTGTDMRRWIAVRFEYDASAHDFSLFVADKRVAHETSTIVPWTDRPLPLDLCHAHGAFRFLGRIRAVRLENIP
jgi:hypothetical protein